MVGHNCGYACGQPLLISIEISNMFRMWEQKQKKFNQQIHPFSLLIRH